MQVQEYLDRHSAHYELSDHANTYTAQQMASEVHVPGMKVAKPVLVRADGQIYMCVLPACCKIDMDALKLHVGAKEIELLDEREMAKLFPDCQLGAEPPFGGLYGLTTIMERSMEKDDYIVFQSGTHDKSIKMSMDEYMKLTHPCILDFGYHLY